jgi:hypothetical protein
MVCRRQAPHVARRDESASCHPRSASDVAPEAKPAHTILCCVVPERLSNRRGVRGPFAKTIAGSELARQRQPASQIEQSCRQGGSGRRISVGPRPGREPECRSASTNHSEGCASKRILHYRRNTAADPCSKGTTTPDTPKPCAPRLLRFRKRSERQPPSAKRGAARTAHHPYCRHARLVRE